MREVGRRREVEDELLARRIPAFELLEPVADVAAKDDVDRLFATAKEKFGRLDVAFNNAGISPPEDDSILDTDLDAWRRVQEVNLTSVYLCCKAALPYMLEQKSGSIINTASFVAVMGAATSQISYSASKGGVPMPNIPQMASVWSELGGAWVKSTKGSGATPAKRSFSVAARNIANKIG